MPIDLARLNIHILRPAKEPMPTRDITAAAAELLGDQWTRTVRINFNCYRSALKTLGILERPRHGYWLLAADADDQLAALGFPDQHAIWKLHLQRRRRKTAPPPAPAPAP